MKYLFSIILIIFAAGCSTTNQFFTPQKINITGDYTHLKTSLIFPQKLGDFERVEIYSFNENGDNAGVTYKSINKGNNDLFTIYIYPAGPASDYRLRQEYFNSLEAIAINNNKEIAADQEFITYKKDNYTAAGVYTKIENKDNTTFLTLFECGKWFLKFRITTDNLGKYGIDSLKESLIKLYNPTEIIKKFPITQKAKIYFTKEAFKARLLLQSIMAEAFSKNKWFNENVDSLEKCSGIPDYYLEAHAYAKREMIKFYEENKSNYSGSVTNMEYFIAIKKIIDNGYLNEFLMDEYSKLLIPKENTTFNFKNYYEWKEKVLPEFHLNKQYYYLECTE